uniref:Uncharacterized protein n=1 Tax=Ditylenchus dipsaci TaxID=166011 RepID=A0A915EGH4_9BILA
MAFEYRRGCSETLPSTAENKESQLWWRQDDEIKNSIPDVSVTSKAHLLCSHVVSFVRSHGYWAIISEQSVETLHRKVNEDERRFASIGDGRRS